MMLHLLSLEWKKLKCYNTFKVLAILYALALPLVFLMGQLFFSHFGKEMQSGNPANEMFNMEAMFMFPEVWDYLGYVGNWLNFFVLGLLSIMLVTNDYSYKTLRQNIMTGMSRNQFFLGKLIIMTALCLAATLYYFLVGMIFGLVNTETLFVHKVTQNMDLIFRYFLQCLAYSSFAFLLGWLFRRMALATIAYIIYVMFLEMVIRYLGHASIIANKTLNFYPMNAAEDLVPFPVKMMREFFKGPVETKMGFSFFLTPSEAVITSLIYTSLFIFLGFRLIKRGDL